MIELKSILESRTVWANLVGLVALLLSVMGFSTSVFDSGQVVDAILNVIAGGSFLASTVFRVIATHKIIR
ncbi:MAG: hypothetical protein ACRCWF_08350 [Beijerinckiaceae bacterium]